MFSDDHEPFVGKLTQKAVLFGPDGNILLCTNEPPEPPGGTFEFGETLVGGLRRELSEELGLDCRVGPPVMATYGLWADENGVPMVSLVYRCETDERAVSLNDEHEAAEWFAPAEAAERLDAVSASLGTAVRRAAALDGSPPFEAVTDPYADSDTSTAAVLDALADARRDADE